MIEITDTLQHLGFLGPIGWKEIVVVLLLVLLLFGGKKLPELARSLAQALRTFGREFKGIQDDLEKGPQDDQEQDQKQQQNQEQQQNPEQTGSDKQEPHEQ